LQTLIPLAPLHQSHNLAGLLGFAKAYPEVPQIACFDTGFHANLPALERALPLNKSLRDLGLRRFGFHGLSYRFVAAHLAEKSPRANKRMLMAHLGNGASLCATLAGKSHATSMGFSTLDGLMMGTRCGALDPGVVLYLLNQSWDRKKIETTLYQDSGLLGVSGISADMRTLRASNEESAAFAIALFGHKVIRECGALIACLGGIDVLAFTGGIGEHDSVLRQQVCQALAFLGMQIDDALNQGAIGTEMMAIHAPSSLVEIWVVPTDEGSVARSDAMALLA
jgi:acetate kinase